MPIHHALWIVADDPVEVKVSALSSERQLEDMIVAEPRILSDEWMLIGRQEDTGNWGASRPAGYRAGRIVGPD